MDRGRGVGAGDAVRAWFKSRVGSKSEGEFEDNMIRGMAHCRAGMRVFAMLLATSASLWAQKAAVPSRVVEAVDDTRTMRLQGNVHPLARAAFDQGALADSQPMT